MEWTCQVITEHELGLQLSRRWGISDLRITCLELGRARDTWKFQVSSAKGNFFLKLKKKVHEPGVSVSRLLAEAGIQVSTPLLSKRGNPWEAVGQLFLMVYPFIEGPPITMRTLRATGWRVLGSALRAVHDADVPESIKEGLTRETFMPGNSDLLLRIQQAVADEQQGNDPTQRHLLRLWSKWGALPAEFFSFVSAIGRTAALSHPNFRLCHGDFQSGNVLQSSTGEITLIDWDDPVWAPPERDLMFLPTQYRTLFAAGYGPLVLDEAVLKFQSSNWLLQEALDCADRILFVSTTGAEEKRWALKLTAIMLQRMSALHSRTEGQTSSANFGRS